jgi:hypothetical protein
MGKKKELAHELELTKLALRGAAQTHEQLLAENEALRAQMAEGVSAPPFRLVTDPVESPTRVKIARALGIDLDTAGTITDEMILVAVERLRNPHLDDGDRAGVKDALVVGKNDSLAEAIQHNRAERAGLLDDVTRARSATSRVAAALGVSQWNKDGDELVEKAQRFGVFHYWLRKRLRDHEQAADLPLEINSMRGALLAAEVRTILAALVGDKELARILQNKPVKASKTVLDLAENPAPTGNLYLDRLFDMSDVQLMRDGFRKLATGLPGARISQLALVFERMHESAAATEELVSWMNAVVLPILRKQHPAYQQATKEN